MADWNKIRDHILNRDHCTCRACGKPHSKQVHHLIARQRGGTHDYRNLVTLCGRCHMFISPVPEWVLTKVWKVPRDRIGAERGRIHWQINKLRNR